MGRRIARGNIVAAWHTKSIRPIAISSEIRSIVSGSLDKTVVVWQLSHSPPWFCVFMSWRCWEYICLSNCRSCRATYFGWSHRSLELSTTVFSFASISLSQHNAHDLRAERRDEQNIPRSVATAPGLISAKQTKRNRIPSVSRARE